MPTPTFVPTDTPTATNFPFTLGVQANVSPERSSQCPVTFVFQATLRANVAGSARYRWEYSDGRVSNDKRVDFNNAGTVEISATWDFSGRQEIHYNGWAQVRVLEPRETLSNQAQFRLDCAAPPTDTPTPTSPPPGLPRGAIVFSSERGGGNQIYVMNHNGDNVRQLTTNAGPNEDGAAASGGQQIVFTHLFSINNGDLYTLNFVNGAQNRLTQGTINWGGSWSPDGSRLVFYSLRDGGKQIYVMNADGSNQRRISSPDCAGDTDDWSPAWSRDGAWIAYESIPHKKCEGGGAADIFISDPNGGNKRNVTRSTGIDDESPNWSPDGRIVFTSNRNGNYDIFVINADGSGLQQLTSGGEDDDYPAWSLDGSTILFQRRQNGNWEIYAMNADGSNLRNLTNNPANDTFPEWVP
ncbi:MAG: hypothetical protein B6D41_08670 [Chloroflexi bacterium UTCFX4]|jgi:TolB protein|nr:MAG: hypothetical protein B6D41_08670 [Chloroflexi bacterium UTCFX4]